MAVNNTEKNIIHYKDIPWNHYQHTLIPVYPPHIPTELSVDECKELISRVKPYFIRWTTRWDCQENTGFWFIIKDTKEDISAYSSKIRNTIQKGTRNFHARIINKEVLKYQGYELYTKALQRYQPVPVPMTEENFRLQFDQLFQIGEWEFWGVFNNSSGKLAGYSMNWIYDRSCEYKTIKLDPFYMKESSNYVLIHEMNNYYLNQKDFLYVNDGSRSLMHESNIQDFLEKKFLFRKAYCQMHIIYNPLVSLVVKGLYPLNRVLFSGQQALSRKIRVLFKHEEIRRNYQLLREK